LEQALISIARDAYRDPREAAVRLLSLGVPSAAIWPAFGVIILVSVVIGGLSDLAVAPAEGVSVSYFLMTLLLAVIFLSFALGIWKIGQAFGGKGRFEESLVVGIFFQGVLLPLQVIQLVLLIVLPGVAGVFGIALLFYGVWVNVNFIDALHGFASFGKSLGVLILASFVAALAMLLVIGLVGGSFGGLL
jgi:hypothetical protein